jgi:hypothetical protein
MQKLALVVIGLSLVIWGVPLLVTPQWLFGAIGGVAQADLAHTLYSRYSGAWFLGVGIIALIAIGRPAGARAVLEVSLIGAGLSAIAIFVDWVSGPTPAADWFVWAAIIDAVVVAVLCVAALMSKAEVTSTTAAAT